MSHQTAWVRVPLPLPVFPLCFPISVGSTLKWTVFIAHDLSGFAFLSALTEGARSATEVSAENRRALPSSYPPVWSCIARGLWVVGYFQFSSPSGWPRSVPYLGHAKAH